MVSPLTMTLKTKLSLGVSLLITLLFAVSSVLIYFLFADFRQGEVETRLRQTGTAVTRIIVSLQEQGAAIPQRLAEDDIETLDGEVTLVFDEKGQLIYSSLTDRRFSWHPEDLQLLAEQGSFFRTHNGRETYGLRYIEGGQTFYTVVSAADSIGQRKQQFLLYVLLGTGLLFTLLAWVIPARLIGRLLQPLQGFLQQVKEVHAHTLDTRIAVQNKDDEIASLADEFNGMLARIEEAYQSQKDFTAHASHELRTPVARLLAQLENYLAVPRTGEEKAFAQKLLEDAHRLSELIASLLLLTRTDSASREKAEACRPDELIFESAEQLARNHPDFRLHLDIQSAEEGADIAEIHGVRGLLLVAFFNLLENAYQYSASRRVDVVIRPADTETEVFIQNDGPVLSAAERQKLFQPFMRGENAREHSGGLGLGLRIVARILESHGAGIGYEVSEKGLNRFVVRIPVG